MTYEEMEKTMQFILEQQAQFATDIQQIRELQAGFHEVQAKFQTQLGTLTDATLTLVGVVGKVAEAQERTEERLSAFITFVERYISGRKGKPEE